MKPKQDVCPRCGGRLFLSNRDGTKTCSSCGMTLGTPDVTLSAASSKEKPQEKPIASSENCPQCGSPAEYLNTDPTGKLVYACAFCGNRFSPKPKGPAPAPEAPKGKEDPNAPHPLDGREIFALAKANTVEVFADWGNTGSAGSGFFFADGYVITNAHVVMDDIEKQIPIASKSIKVRFKEGRYTECTLVAVSPKEDMAILKTNLKCTNIARIASQMPETGETIYAVGNSAGEGMCILEGIVADQLREIANNDYMMISANIVGGNSGGPIFSRMGEVVGIVTLGSNRAVAMNYGIPIPRIERFIDEVSKMWKINFRRPEHK